MGIACSDRVLFTLIGCNLLRVEKEIKSEGVQALAFVCIFVDIWHFCILRDFSITDGISCKLRKKQKIGKNGELFDKAANVSQ